MFPQQEFSDKPLNALEIIQRFTPKNWFKVVGPEGEITTYCHVVAEEFCEFWVPEGKDEFWAIAELVRAYRQRITSEMGAEFPPAPLSQRASAVS